ncbi:MAG: CinA family protein [Erysipelotrichaceae bacterium]
MEELLLFLKNKNWTIGSCESLTAGLFCDKLAEVAGASAVLKGGIITYQTNVKTNLVKVDPQCLKTYGVVSEACAKAMAVNTKALLNCDICVSFSGNAGPDTLEGKPVGYVCCAIATPTDLISFTLQLSGSRNEIRLKAVNEMVKRVLSL